MMRIRICSLAGAVSLLASTRSQAPVWSPLETTPDPAAIAWDARLQRVVMAGGQRVFEWDGNVAVLRSQPLAPVDALHFDPVGNRLLAVQFGSASVGTWSGGDWQWQSSPGISSLLGAVTAFDEHRQRLVALSPATTDVFEWDGYQWWRVVTAGGPQARTGGALAYDPGQQRLVLYGGTANSVDLADTWTYDGSHWTQTSSFAAPGSRSGAAFAYDPSSNSMLLYGGGSDTVTWARLQGGAWAAIATAHAPGVRRGARLTFDGRGMLLTGGGPSNAAIGHRFTGTDWVEVSSFGEPRSTLPALGRDRLRQQLVAFGGTDANLARHDETFLYDTQWCVTAPAHRPAARSLAQLAWSQVDGAVLLWGGVSAQSQALTDTWLWNGVDWTQRTPPTAPPHRYNFVLSPDPTGGVLLFGGSTQTAGFWRNDQYRWDGTNWQQLVPALRPGAMQYGHAFDETRNRLVMVPGGVQPTQVWEWDGLAWISQPLAATLILLRTLAYSPQANAVVASFATANVRWTGTAWVAHPLPATGNSALLTPHRGNNLLLLAPTSFGENRLRLQFASATPASVTPIGSGCALGPAPQLATLAMPRLGEAAFAFDVGTLAANAPTLLAFGLTEQAVSLGAGCGLYVGSPVGSVMGVASNGGQFRQSLPIPNDATLAGVRFDAQAAVIAPAQSLFGTFTATGALRVTIGD